MVSGSLRSTLTTSYRSDGFHLIYFVIYCQLILEYCMVSGSLRSTVTTSYRSDGFHLIYFQRQLVLAKFLSSKETNFSLF